MADTAPKSNRTDTPPPPKSEAEKTTAKETADTQAAMVRKTTDADGEPRWGESSDPVVHKLLAEIGALESNRRELDPPDNDEAIAALDVEIEAKYNRLRNLGKPEAEQLRIQRDAAASKGDVLEVAALDAKLDGTDTDAKTERGERATRGDNK
jgi:hypothetical protein